MAISTNDQFLSLLGPLSCPHKVITSMETTLQKAEQEKCPQNLPTVPTLHISQNWITCLFLTNLVTGVGLLELAQPSWDPPSRARGWVTVSWAYKRSEVGTGVEEDDASQALFRKSHTSTKERCFHTINDSGVEIRRRKRVVSIGGPPAWSTAKGKVSVRCKVYCMR